MISTTGSPSSSVSVSDAASRRTMPPMVLPSLLVTATGISSNSSSVSSHLLPPQYGHFFRPPRSGSGLVSLASASAAASKSTSAAVLMPFGSRMSGASISGSVSSGSTAPHFTHLRSRLA
ncbi:hypothetical protein 2209_scaffold64_00087 [Bacteriophage sp.]|nr:hypothetical protein 2209_scaffold64_00087 [Bacteriophage sp.]